MADLKPSAVVITATIRALKYNGGVSKTELLGENLEALEKGIVNLDKHIENIKKYNLPIVVAINRRTEDTDAEIAFLENHCRELNCRFALAEVWAKGGEGGIALAKEVLEAVEEESNFKCLYEDELSLKDKIATIAREIYGADGVTYDKEAEKTIAELEKLGFGNMPVCMAKNQYSLSDDPTKLGRPSGFTVNIREVYVSAGAGFVVAITGTIMTMPGLPKVPAAENIDVDADGNIDGLF